MTLFTPNYSFPISELSDTPNGAAQIDALAEAIDSQLAVTDADVAANATRAALLTALLGSGVGMQSTQTNGSATTTGTSNAAMSVSAVIVGHSFLAPLSGIVRFAWAANVSHSLSSGSTIVVGCAVATGGTVGSGTIVSDTVDVDSFQVDGTNNTPGYKSRPVIGLTPGDTYNVFLKWRETGSGTATARNPSIESIPMLA
jgi:hypothetical protein